MREKLRPLAERGAEATWSPMGSIQPGRYRSRF